MAHVEPLAREDLPELAGVFAGAEMAMGFVPNSMLTMAHMPQLTVAFSMLANVLFGGDLKPLIARMAEAVPDQGAAEDNLPPDVVQLIAFSVSVAAGCRYCQAHTSGNMVRSGGDQDKLNEVLRFETSTLLSPAEKAVVGLALAAGAVPNAAEPEHFEALIQHFNERQIVQIVGVISLFGFLNRWNDTMATQLESHPVDFAASALTQFDWGVGKHG